jgi:hypothetical protein
MTVSRCRGVTQDGTRCLNRGNCPHHSGGRAKRTATKTRPAVVTGWATYSPTAPKSRVQDNKPTSYEPAPAWLAQQEARLAALEKQMRYDNMLATNARQRKLGVPELVSPRDYEEFYDGPGQLKPRPTVPDAPKATPKPRWPQYADTDWKGKRHEDMTPGQQRAMTDELHRGSRELVEAKEQGWGEFFRTMFRRKK